MRFSKDHLWVKYNLETQAGECGITFYAQKRIGKANKINLPVEGSEVPISENFGTIETRTSVLNLFSPVGFQVVSVV